MSKGKKRQPRRRQKRSRHAAGRGPRDPHDASWSQVTWSHVDRAFAAFEPESLISLISAAADSPGCCHRLPSLTVLWSRTVTHCPDGAATASPSDLATLLVAAHKAAPQLRYVEDCWNVDPRLVVCHAIDNDRLRIHPGAHTDPSQLLRVITATASAIDSSVVDRHGFSLSDLLEVALRYSHWRTGQLAQAWPTEALARDNAEPEDEDFSERIGRIAATPVALSDEELEAVRSLDLGSAIWLSHCSYPDRALAAWEWAITHDELSLCLEPMALALGKVLAVERRGLIRPVPASLVLDALAASTGVLAAEAATDAASVSALRVGTVHRAAAIFGISHQIPQDDALDRASQSDTSSGSLPGVGLATVALPGRRHAFAIGVVSGLDRDGLVTAINAAESMLTDITVEQLIEAGAGIDETAVVRRVVIYGGPLRERPPETPGAVHLHVEDLASISFEVQQPELGFDLVYQFLDELATMPGITEVASLDYMDIWRHWKSLGVLNPTGAHNIVLALAGVSDDTAWQSAAQWEPIESVLTAANLPPVSAWYVAELDERGHATLYTHQCDLVHVLAEPPLIVATSLTGGLADLGFDPAFCRGLTDGLLLTCANYPDVASGLVLQSNVPLLIHVEFTVVRPTGPDDDHVRIGFQAGAERRPFIGLLIGPDWLELLAENPRAAHSVLGQALAHSLDRLQERYTNDEWETTRAKFAVAWEGAPPVAMLHYAEAPLPVPSKGAETLPRSQATKARANRTLAAAIQEDGIAPCQLLGPEAQDACQTQILPATTRTLKQLVADWTPDAILSVVEHLNAAQGERARAIGEIERALAAPWGAHWRSEALAKPDASERTQPLEFLLEVLIAERPQGSIAPDRFDIAEATAFAHLAIQIGRALEGADRGLHSLAVSVQNGGITHVIAIPESHEPGTQSEKIEGRSRAPVNVGAYLAAERAHQLRLRDADGHEPSVALRLGEQHPRQTSAFIPLASLDGPNSLDTANRVMLEACGTGLDGINAVLGTALCWTAGGDSVVHVSRAELCDTAQTWSTLPTSQIEAALDRLILDPNQISREGARYWEQDRRRHRLLTRPLIPYDEQLIIMPWQIHATQGVYLRYISEGRLPWHPSEIPEQVRNAFNIYRRVANRNVERVAAQVAADLQMPHKANIHENEAAEFGLHLPGEVDLMIADADRSRIWVCEVKDVSAGFSPQTIRSRIGKFLDDGDYIGKLVARTTAIEESPDAAARLLAAPTSPKRWRVIPLMITRHVEMAAFLDDVPVTFTVVDDLAATLQSDSDPKSGHTPVGSR